MSANPGAPRAPQRSPFAIQELLGLSDRDGRDARERYFESRDAERVLNLSEGRDRGFGPQFPLPVSVASRVAYAAAFNAQAAVAAAFLPGPPLLHPPHAGDVGTVGCQPGCGSRWSRLSAGCECSTTQRNTPSSNSLLRVHLWTTY
ncbi:unnamed protein product [Leptidea sinapis]|uniref:Uncharacterized protein n=1 Tax=Leptidea sinapis TaxID=189913 RepID=A0A5E4PY71_9NEOP|nr:unnamed protein product [Leptidea sinapis]